jgi:hypothetical protein
MASTKHKTEGSGESMVGYRQGRRLTLVDLRQSCYLKTLSSVGEIMSLDSLSSPTIASFQPFTRIQRRKVIYSICPLRRGTRCHFSHG